MNRTQVIYGSRGRRRTGGFTHNTKYRHYRYVAPAKQLASHGSFSSGVYHTLFPPIPTTITFLRRFYFVFFFFFFPFFFEVFRELKQLFSKRWEVLRETSSTFNKRQLEVSTRRYGIGQLKESQKKNCILESSQAKLENQYKRYTTIIQFALLPFLRKKSCFYNILRVSSRYF